MGTVLFCLVVYYVVVMAMLTHDAILKRYPSLPEHILGKLPVLNRSPEGVPSAQLRQAVALVSELVHGTFNITDNSKAAAQDWLKRAAQPQPEETLLAEARVLLLAIETENKAGTLEVLTPSQSRDVSRWLDIALERR